MGIIRYGGRAPDFRKPLLYKDLRQKKVQNNFIRKISEFYFRWTHGKREKVSPAGI